MTKQSNFELPKKRKKGENLEERMTENAYKRILPARYLKKDGDGNVKETPEQLFERVAENVAQPDKKYDDIKYEDSKDEFYNLMTSLKFMPNSPTLMNAGTDIQQLSACFVTHPEDNMESIFETSKEAALIHKSGGGTGYPFHLLRPKGDLVKTTGGVSSGPMSFMQVFDATCGTVKQGGKRRGAQMGIMRVDHPDILRFIVSKRQEGNLSNFNISVGITDDFMEAVKKDEEYELLNPKNDEVFKTAKQTVEFYSSDPDNYPQAKGSDQGKDDNFWRDFADTFSEEIYNFESKLKDLEEGEPFTLPAQFIFETMIDGAWRNGEPGFYNYDEANKKHSYDVQKKPEYKMESTNPCVAEGTLVNTPEGYKRVENIDEGDLINTTFGAEPVDEVKTFEERPVYKVKFSDGGEQTVTEGHRYQVKKKGSHSKHIEELPLREIEEGDHVRVSKTSEMPKANDARYKEGLRKGIMLGDGSYTEKTIENKSVKISFNEENKEYIQNVKELFGEQHFQANESGKGKTENLRFKNGKGRNLVNQLGLEPAKSPEKTFDITKIETETEATGLLDGLLLSDGNINMHSNHPNIRWNTASPELAKNIRRLLISIGCHGRIPNSVKDDISEIEGRELSRNNPVLEVNISGESVREYIEKSRADEYSPQIKEHYEELKREWFTTGNTWKAKVESIKPAGTAKVYDLYSEGSDTWITEGYTQKGCAEQPLMNYEACNLGHINLSLLVEKDAKKHGEFIEENIGDRYPEQPAATRKYVRHALNREELETIAKTATRFLDNVVTMSDFPLEEIEETVKDNRKIGLGLMGFAQMLIQMGVEYGSRTSIIIAEEIQRLITQYSVEESHRLAEVRGTFRNWEDSKWADPVEYCEWFETFTGGNIDFPAEEYSEGFKMRNHNTTTIAPTGTTSMLGDTSGGAEPVYSLAYFKNVAKDIQGEDMLVEFDDYFIQALEHNNVDVEKVKEDAKNKMMNNEWKGVQSISDEILPPQIKKLFKTAKQVKPEEHIDIQAAFQHYNHSGISKTANFDNDATRQDVKDTYIRAWEKGVKGFTIYRDGTRDTQVMQTNKDNKITSKIDVLEWLDDAEKGAVQEIHSKIEEKILGKGGER